MKKIVGPYSATLFLAIVMVALVQVPVEAQTSTLSGVLHFVWGDPTAPGAEPLLMVYLALFQGASTRLRFTAASQPTYPDLLQMNGRVVTATGSRVAASARGQSEDVFDVVQLDWVRPAVALPDALVSGAQPWVTLRCRFGDSTGVDRAINTSILTGSSFPSLDEYWREVSYDNITLAGSAVNAWVNLPQPRSYYVVNDAGGVPHADLQKLADDCTAASDDTVDFSAFVGITMLFNQSLDCCLWGGSQFLTLDGDSKIWRTTWVGLPTDNYALIYAGLAHETGHGFGFPHSSGPYSAVYDSNWDIMSNPWTYYDPTISQYNPQHTITYHKDLAGWICPGRKFVPTSGTTTTITLERTASPISSTNYLMAMLPIGGSSTHFYTVEMRQLVAHDAHLPGTAVVIHDVLTNRSGGSPARVVDPDGNGDPNDAAAMWITGESFVDQANGIVVTVNSLNATSATVTIDFGSLFTLSPEGKRFGNAGGSGSLTIQTANPSLPWTASTAASWITLGATAGTGTATVPFTVAPTSLARRGTITVAGLTFNVAQGWPGPSDDVDGDGRGDLSIYRPSTGGWWILHSSVGYSTYATYGWGLTGDIPVPGDYDGDGKADIAIYRPSTGGWWILYSSTNFATYNTFGWGLGGDLPVPADYDGDGKTDIAIYRPSTAGWWILKSSTNFSTYTTLGWGLDGDVPVPADYDGDGKADIAVYRPSTGGWWILKSGTNYATYSTYGWGLPGDVPVHADYDGDGKTDPAIYRPSTAEWWILKSSTSYDTYSAYGWGMGGDVPVPADYDGDGVTDIAIYRPSTAGWWILKSSSGYTTYSSYGWGLSGDVAVLKRP